MLFLLLQVTITSPDCPHAVGVSNPWTEYVRMLPSSVPVPTCWSEQERTMLVGTSLEVGSHSKWTIWQTVSSQYATFSPIFPRNLISPPESLTISDLQFIS